MADLRDKQLSERYQTLITTSNITDASPLVGALQNGQGAALTQVTLANGTASEPAYSFTADTDTGMFSSGTGLLDLVTAGSTALTINGNQLTVGLGSVSAPSYSFIGDVNTGLFASGADAIGLVTGGTSRLAIDSSGNVGIGGTATKKLDIHHADTDGLRFTTADGAETFIDFGDASDNDIGGIRYDHNDNHMRLRTNNAERIRMFSDGDISFMSVSQNRDFYWDAGNSRLGLGTDTPDQLLHLKGTSPFMSISHSSDNSTSGILFRRTDNDQNRGNILYDFANDAMTFRVSTNGTGESMRITSAGSVGIGETSVDAKLHLTTATAGLVNQKFESAGGAAWRLGVPASQTYFAFDNANDDLSSPKLVIDTNGKVGIGTASPSQKLEVHDASSTTTSNDGGVGIVIKNTNSTDNNQGSLEFQNSAGTKTASIISTFTDHSSNEGQLSFCTGPGGGTFAEAMRIDANGRVGIGVTSPSLALEVSDNNTNGVLGVKNTSNDRNTFKSSNAAGTRTLDIGNNSSGHGILNIRNSSGTVNTQLLGSGDSYFNGGDVLIGKTSSGIAVDGVEFNTSSHFTNFTRERNSSGGTIMQVNRTGSEDGSVISFMRSGSEKGSISVTSSATAFNTSSDYRLKENITSLSSCIDTVSKIKPSTFNFIDTPNQTVDGFIAHELAEVVPQAVSGEKDGIDEHGEPIYQGVDHSKLVPLLVGAIQELKAEIEQLKNK